MNALHKLRRSTLRLARLLVAGWLLTAPRAGLPADVQFNAHIRPILAEHCLQCHGHDEQQRQADLRLDQELSARRALVTNGNEPSEIISRVTTDDLDLRMPPPDSGHALSREEVELLRQWVAEGAPFDRHWAFQPVVRPQLPPCTSQPTSEIDSFIHAELQRRKLTLSDPINRPQWIRRATFDLLGLPPSWQEVQAFVADRSPDAYARVIDRLLQSPRYGERWGRHWLDLARYADTHGGSAIGFTKFPFSYTYRDYVVSAFNRDVPYDRFVLEQVAADQLGLCEDDPTLAALGFLTVGMQFVNPHDIVDDRIDVITRGLMGVTVTCARCHDHKYDPIPTEDYYALYAALASSRVPDELPIVGGDLQSAAYREYADELVRQQTVVADTGRDQAEVLRGRLRMQVGLYLKELARGTPELDLSAAFLSYRTDDVRPQVLERWRTYLGNMPADDPVFGPWIQLSDVSQSDFLADCQTRVKHWREENGDPAQFATPQQLNTPAPKWNPRVLDAIEAAQPASLSELADVYGQLFASVHRQWLEALLAASLEATTSDSIVPDQDPQHATINSSVERQLRRHLYHLGTPTAMPDELAVEMLNRTVRDDLSAKQSSIHNLHLNSPGSPPRAMVLEEDPDRDAFYIFRRGSPIDRGARVHPHFLSILTDGVPKPFPAAARRLSLGQRIVDPRNPLTPRVIVNWVWQHHFGQGLVRTPDDFGTRGRSPTHPELLDYLASDFVEQGWSLKQLHRQIMLSNVYRQAASENADARTLDPDNESLWRMPRRRLDLEAMRDAMLAVSGELDTANMGGPPFDLLAEPITAKRTLYGFINRDIISTLDSTFDRANPNACTARRPETYVPQQTLFALNSDFIQDRARAWAESTASITDPAERIQAMYRRAYAREPEQAELQAALDFVEQPPTADDRQSTQDSSAWQQLAHVLLAANEFVFLD